MQELNRYLKDVHTTSKSDNKSLEVAGKIILTTITLWMGVILIFKNPPWIFLDNVNLIIHEAGHFVFSGFGELIQYLGGTILQLLIPVLFGVYFLVKKNFFAFFFILFWVGNNFINIAVYIKDAQIRQLPLIGGGDHDWYYILSRLDIIDYSEVISSFIDLIGAVFVLIGILLMVIITTKQLIISQTKETN